MCEVGQRGTLCPVGGVSRRLRGDEAGWYVSARMAVAAEAALAAGAASGGGFAAPAVAVVAVGWRAV